MCVAGEDVVSQINESYCDEKGRPYQDIRIHHTVILHDPFSDPEVRISYFFNDYYVFIFIIFILIIWLLISVQLLVIRLYSHFTNHCAII